ncbi:MAG: hypothetical protein RIC56_03700 [Pseudomonadales bacterium]
MSNGKRQPGRNASGLLGDLESIRSLLEEPDGLPPEQREVKDSDDAPAPAREGDEDVPLLEDVVHGGVSVNETFLAGEGDFQEAPGASGLNDEIFKALLSDEWRESARALLDQAREAIEQHQTEWTPEHTDELNAALKVRIDETVQNWLREVVQSRAEELRQALLKGLSEQIHITIDEQFGNDEDPDGE